MLKHVQRRGQQHIVHVPQPIVDPLNFRGLCLKECIPAGRKTMRVLRIVSFGDHFSLASAKRSVRYRGQIGQTPFLVAFPRSYKQRLADGNRLCPPNHGSSAPSALRLSQRGLGAMTKSNTALRAGDDPVWAAIELTANA